MKKATCKGDRKKKKELTEEITRREAELEKRHNEEMTNFKLSQLSLTTDETAKPDMNENENNEEALEDKDDINDTDSVEKQPANQKVSRAQRRRQKKAKEEEERNQLIIEQEAINQFGKRNLEMQAIQEILLKRDLMVYEIPSDGHWFVFFSTFLCFP